MLAKENKISNKTPVLCPFKYFISNINTRRFIEGQKVWVIYETENHLWVIFKLRDKGRYIRDIIDKLEKSVGEIKTMDITPDFAIILSSVF